MFKKNIFIEDKKYEISIFNIWKKLNWDNLYTDIGRNKYKWRIMPKFKSTLHICNICRGLSWVSLFAISVYIEIYYEMLTYFSGNIFLISLNIIIIFLPIVLMEIFILHKASIEVVNSTEKSYK